MEVDAPQTDRHILKRKATETINEGWNTEKRCRKSQTQKPRDLDSYKKIIKTYKAPIWYGCAMSPRDLADFGWACVRKDSVQCVECEQHLCTKLPNICTTTYNAYNSSLKDVHEKLVSAHRSTCKLRSGAPSFRVNEPSSKEILEGIQGRLAECKNIEEDAVKTEIPSDVNLPKIDGVPKPLVYLSALGWKVSHLARGTIILGCDLCARELVVASGSCFDPVHNHERWCPLIEMDEQGQPSWQTDLNIVLNTKNRIGNRYSDSNIFKEAFAARRLIDSSLSTIITPSIV